MSYLCQKCPKNIFFWGGGGGVTVFVSVIKRMVDYTEGIIVKNIEGESTEANDLNHIL